MCSFPHKVDHAHLIPVAVAGCCQHLVLQPASMCPRPSCGVPLSPPQECGDWRWTSQAGKQQQGWTAAQCGSQPLKSDLPEEQRKFFFVFAVCFTSLDSKTNAMRQTKQFLDINYSDESCLKLRADPSQHFALGPSVSLIQSEQLFGAEAYFSPRLHQEYLNKCCTSATWKQRRETLLLIM